MKRNFIFPRRFLVGFHLYMTISCMHSNLKNVESLDITVIQAPYLRLYKHDFLWSLLIHVQLLGFFHIPSSASYLLVVAAQMNQPLPLVS